MKTRNRLITLLAFLSAITCPVASWASYFDLVPSSNDPLEVVSYDARYPYWTQGIYIATYPLHSFSKEGWMAEYYGGVQLNGPARQTHLLWSTWQMHGKNAPASGIDFVFAGPGMGWHRSTWEGSSGGVSGMWPVDEFNVNHWYRFVHRVWRPTDDKPHTGYAGVWIKDLQSGIWRHTATFKFPAELTGFNNMQGFMEWFGGVNTPDKAAVEFRNIYSFNGGRWNSRTAFDAYNGQGSDTIKLTAGENGDGVLMETTANPFEPGTHKRTKSPVVRQNFTIHQPEQLEFDPVKIGSPSAEWMGNTVVVRWAVDSKSSPQLGYDIQVLDGTNVLAKVSENDPQARQSVITLPSVPAGTVNIRMTLRDIFNQTSPPAQVTATASSVLAAKNITGLTPGISYRYYQTGNPESWTHLPDLAGVTPVFTGTTAVPDITPRLSRNGYAFDCDGYLHVPTDGLYTFNLTTASGGRFLVDGKVVIDADGDRSIDRYTGSVALQAGVHSVHVLFYHGQGRQNQADDFLQLTWSGPGFETTLMPASVFMHTPTASEATLTASANLVNGIQLKLSSNLIGGSAKSVQYYAINDHFDYFDQQGAQSENYFLTAANEPGKTVSAPIWGGGRKTIFARAILTDNRTVDSAPVVVDAAPASPDPDANGMTLTELEHHLYPMNHAVEDGAITLVGDSVGLLTRPQKGDVTLIAHLAGITSDKPLADGTRLDNSANWYSGIILRDNLDPRPGEPLGGKTIPFIALFGSADGATRRCDSTMINGAGNQPSGDIGSDCKWFKLTRKGQQLIAYISQDGQTWKQVSSIDQPNMHPEIQIGFVHYSIPCSTPVAHWAKFDHLSISNQVP